MSRNLSSGTSGFISRSANASSSSLVRSDDEKGGSKKVMNSRRKHSMSSSTASSDTSAISDTFKSFIDNHTKPYYTDYDAFATSYLCTELPFDRIICEDSSSYEDIQCPFPDPVPIDIFLVQQTTRQSMGPSLRKSRIIPTTQWIFNDLQCKMPLLTDAGERYRYLYSKARQWCDVNKALAMDHKYPKPDPNILRSKYSKSHQKAMKLARRDMGISRKDPIHKCGPITAFSKHFIQTVLAPVSPATGQSNICYTTYDPGTGEEINEEQLKKWSTWTENLANVFADIKPLEELQTKETHWQAEAIKSLAFRPKPKKKRFWKRNVYPPMTLEDYIRTKRQLLPPLKPEHLQTDYLSGIWEPELMNPEFEITPMNYDCRIPRSGEGISGGGAGSGEGNEPDQISWWVSHEATQKCWQWLKKIPSNL